MIGYLRGECLEVTASGCLLGVGAATGGAHSVVGYDVRTPARAGYNDLLPGERVAFWIYTHVREDQLDLYGFRSAQEKAFFMALLSVNGVGPKSALALLSAAEPQAVLAAILEGDKDFLTDLPGIGEKTAARMVLELKKKLSKMVEEGVLAAGPVTPKAASVNQEARDALVGLGFKESDIARAFESLGESAREMKSEALIKAALKQL